MKHLKAYSQFINEGKPAGAPDWHDSDAPDAEGRFRDLSPKDLAAWLIKTRKKDLKRISGSLTQQVVFNRNEDPEYAEKMERTRKEVYKQLGREDLLDEGKKPGPDAYMTGLDDETEEDKKDQMKKQAEMDDDDPAAYKELPGDKEAREKGKVKTSKHVKKYHELYGEETDEALSDYEDKDADYDKLYKKYKYKSNSKRKKKSLVKEESEDGYRLRILSDVGGDQATDWLADNPINFDKLKFALRNNAFTKYDLRDVIQGKATKSIEKKVMKEISESLVTEEKAKGDRGKIDDAAIEKGLKNKADETGVPIGLLRIVMRRGLAAWKTGHRPGATQQQWGYARVNSFLTKQPGTWGGADKDVAKEVRDGGHDKKLKKA
jgi:hypothetical protein